MDQKTYDIAMQFIDFSYWGNPPRDQVPIWELRDILSHHDKDYGLPAEEDQLVNDIINNIDREFAWDSNQLTIAGEAKVQQLLAMSGRNLKCYNLNVFPTNTQDLNKYVEKYSIITQLAARIDHFKNRTKPKLNYIKRAFKCYMFKQTIVVALAVAYGLTVAPELLLWALAVAYVLCNCITITIHEYWVHDLLTPKNRLIGFILDYMGHILYGTERLEWRYRHSYHHIHWKTEYDLDKKFVKTPWWVYLLFGVPYVSDSPLAKAEQDYHQAWPTYRANQMRKLLPESKFLEKYSTAIKYTSHIAVILIFGVVNWIFFFLLQEFIFERYILGFNEIVTHHNDLTREQEADTPHLFPICCGTAYHNTHHFNPKIVVIGPGKLKYLNVQYYFIKLCYKLKEGARLS